VEELHIELVILDDEDLLGHSGPVIPAVSTWRTNKRLAAVVFQPVIGEYP
jgi:hypothetical protein